MGANRYPDLERALRDLEEQMAKFKNLVTAYLEGPASRLYLDEHVKGIYILKGLPRVKVTGELEAKVDRLPLFRELLRRAVGSNNKSGIAVGIVAVVIIAVLADTYSRVYVREFAGGQKVLNCCQNRNLTKDVRMKAHYNPIHIGREIYSIIKILPVPSLVFEKLPASTLAEISTIPETTEVLRPPRTIFLSHIFVIPHVNFH
ncbi:hypothetical protein BDZ45DRAFT_762294 [Acephala macrosclerotiorum]|nr:hypothetical protein BDZ45DRAFT_762294 [Acephala macrosclerotiorum]